MTFDVEGARLRLAMHDGVVARAVTERDTGPSTHPQTSEVISLWRGSLIVRRGPTMASIAAEVAAEHGLTVAELKGPSRIRGIAHPRQEAMARMRAETNCSTTKIGQFFGRDHSTVIYGCRAALARQANAS